MLAENLPHVSREFPGVGGVIKKRPEDFFVQEIPLYEPSGSGPHVFCEIEKVNVTTFDAVDRLAQALKIHPRDVGYAGMKDAAAVTRQIFSVPTTDPSMIMNLVVPGLKIQWAARHQNKLRLGHLRGNRFAVKIRQVNRTDVVRLTPLVKQLQERGMPNYFGEQRFGRRRNNHLLGAALIRYDNAGVLKHLLGQPSAEDDPSQRAARSAFDSGDFQLSMKRFPRSSGMERRILARFIKTKNPSSAVGVIDQRLRRLWISALQSEIFNHTVAARIETLGTLMNGDLAEKHDSGGVFHVEEASVEQPRADRFEISPTGPLIGYRMTMPAGKPLEIEESVSAAANIKPGDFRVAGRLKVKGARRTLRVQPKDLQLSAGVDEHGPYITVAFELPAGSFATVLLRELMKTEVD